MGDFGAPGAAVNVLLGPTLLEVEVVRYVGLIFLATFEELVSRCRVNQRLPGGEVSGGTGGVITVGGNDGGTGSGGVSRTVRSGVVSTFPTCSSSMENFFALLSGTVLLEFELHVFCNTWHLCGL